MALLIECREGAFFCSSFQAENDQISANQDWAIIFQVPLPSHAKVLSKYNNRVQISPAGFSPYLGWRWRICIIYLFIFFILSEEFERLLLKMRQRIYGYVPGSWKYTSSCKQCQNFIHTFLQSLKYLSTAQWAVGLGRILICSPRWAGCVCLRARLTLGFQIFLC